MFSIRPMRHVPIFVVLVMAGFMSATTARAAAPGARRSRHRRQLRRSGRLDGDQHRCFRPHRRPRVEPGHVDHRLPPRRGARRHPPDRRRGPAGEAGSGHRLRRCGGASEQRHHLCRPWRADPDGRRLPGSAVAELDGQPHARRPGRPERRFHLSGPRLHSHHRFGERRDPDRERQACNVVWQVGSSATLGTGSSFTGDILALQSITVNHGATVNGRTLARNGAVTLDQNTISRAVCSDGSTTATTGPGGEPPPPPVPAARPPPPPVPAAQLPPRRVPAGRPAPPPARAAKRRQTPGPTPAPVRSYPSPALEPGTPQGTRCRAGPGRSGPHDGAGHETAA